MLDYDLFYIVLYKLMEVIPEVVNPLMLKMKDITLEFLTNPLYHNMINSKSGLINSNKINKKYVRIYS